MAKRILYGVLNWGLSHATRSKVVIENFLHAGYSPVIASDGLALDYLRSEFPSLEFRELRSYQIRYNSSNFQLPSILASLPAMAMAAMAEKKAAQQMIEELAPVGVVSDNRLGFYHPKVPSVFITNQLNPEASFLSKPAAWAHRLYYRKFDEVWVHDTPEASITGKLNQSNYSRLKFMGVHSALKPKQGLEKNILIVLSGPEPQRSILEERLLKQIVDVRRDFVLVRGTKKEFLGNYPSNLKVFDFIGAEQMQVLMAEAELVISRSGHGSLIDYYCLGKKALLIPTPGQTEQEYLARYHRDKGLLYAVKQNKLDLKRDLELALSCPGFPGKIKAFDRELFNLFSK